MNLSERPELWQEVSEYLMTSDFLSLRLVCKAIANYIFPIYLVRPKKLLPLAYRVRYLDLSHTKLALESEFPNLLELAANYAPNVKRVPPTVRVLHCAATSGISQQSLEKLDLLKINFQRNPKISDISSQKNLETIGAGPSLTQQGIQGLTKVRTLCFDKSFSAINYHIYDVSFMSLRKLILERDTRIGQTSLNYLTNLVVLECKYHQDIFDVSMCPLKRLIAPGTRISRVPSTLIELDCRYTRTLVDLSHLTKLRWLQADYSNIEKLAPGITGQYSLKGVESLSMS